MQLGSVSAVVCVVCCAVLTLTQTQTLVPAKPRLPSHTPMGCWRVAPSRGLYTLTLIMLELYDMLGRVSGT